LEAAFSVFAKEGEAGEQKVMRLRLANRENQMQRGERFCVADMEAGQSKVRMLNLGNSGAWKPGNERSCM
jgi:hypothetical protein